MSIDYLHPPEHLLNAPIEPWDPKIGDRVRVRLNGECQVPLWRWSPLGVQSMNETHDHREHGQIGTVNQHPDWARQAVLLGHPYAVWFDQPIRINTGLLVGACYAACELEPLDKVLP